MVVVSVEEDEVEGLEVGRFPGERGDVEEVAVGEATGFFEECSGFGFVVVVDGGEEAGGLFVCGVVDVGSWFVVRLFVPVEFVEEFGGGGESECGESFEASDFEDFFCADGDGECEECESGAEFGAAGGEVLLEQVEELSEVGMRWILGE